MLRGMSDHVESPTRIQDAAQARADLAAKIVADLDTLSAMFPVDGDEFAQDHRGESRVNDALAAMRKAAIGMREHVTWAAKRDEHREAMSCIKDKVAP